MLTTIRQLLSGPVLQWGPHHGPHWGGAGSHMGTAGGIGATGLWGGFWTLLLPVVLLAGFVFLAYALYRVRGEETSPHDDALTTLNARYARGDI